MATKECGACYKVKPYADFYRRVRYRQYPDTDAGYSNRCRSCDKIDRKHRRADNKQNNWEITENSRLKRVYGITLADYSHLLEKQKGRCLGCTRHYSQLNSKLAVDHCHLTGTVRGLLCLNCNSVLGQARDNINVLQNLINYLTPGLADNTSISTIVDNESRVNL